jgi:hypothetical protein
MIKDSVLNLKELREAANGARQRLKLLSDVERDAIVIIMEAAASEEYLKVHGKFKV